MTRAHEQPLSSRTTCFFLGIILCLAFTLRIAAAQGGLWTDEAWSMVYAQEAGGPLGVVTRINHDNNHHINSWWMQLVGEEAPPILVRLLSILASVATCWVVALIALRRSRLVAIVTAFLFAISPIMMLYGSEARGYAPMLLMFALMIWRIDGWMRHSEQPFPRGWLALFALVGALSHLLMIPATLLAGIWVFAEAVRRMGMKKAIPFSIEAMAPAGIVALSVVVLIIIMAAISPDGMRVGGYTAYSFHLYMIALGDLSGLMTGIGPVFGSILLAGCLAAALAILPLVLPARFPPHRRSLYLILLLTMPVAILVLMPGNSQFARYHLPLAFGFILITGDWIGSNLERRGLARIAAAFILTLFVGGNLYRDRLLIENRRGQSDLPVATIMRLAPNGSAVRLNIERIRAIVQVAAWQKRYPLRITKGDCGLEPFVLIDRTGEGPAVDAITQCNIHYTRVAAANANSASGQSWTLFAKAPLQSQKPAVNSAPSRR
jgi:hypothetical protein